MQRPKLSMTADDNSPSAARVAPSGTGSSSQQEGLRPGYSLISLFPQPRCPVLQCQIFPLTTNQRVTCHHPGTSHSAATVTVDMTYPHHQKAGWVQFRFRYTACPAEHSQGPELHPQGGEEANGEKWGGGRDSCDFIDLSRKPVFCLPQDNLPSPTLVRSR